MTVTVTDRDGQNLRGACLTCLGTLDTGSHPFLSETFKSCVFYMNYKISHVSYTSSLPAQTPFSQNFSQTRMDRLTQGKGQVKPPIEGCWLKKNKKSQDFGSLNSLLWR